MLPDLLQNYIRARNPEQISSGMLAYLASLETVARTAPQVARSIVHELLDQRRNIKLIASENFSSMAVQCAMGNLLTDKYAEGIPFRRFYAGCDNVDALEDFARKEACALFGAQHAYVQPHSGADANLVAYSAILAARVEVPMMKDRGAKSPFDMAAIDWEAIRQASGNQRLLGLDLDSGGHLTHGRRLNISSKLFDARSYSVNRQTGLLDYDEIEKIAIETRPLILLAGYSAYPRKIDFARMRAIADKIGAVFMVDMAHFAGLVAGGVFTGEFNPVPHAHVVTTTTHKTLRGPRGGLILCTSEFAEQIDKGCPLVQGGPLPHVIAAKGVCFAEARQPEFRDYAARIVKNSQALADACQAAGITVVSGGTDNHLVLLNITSFGLTGRQAESALRDCGVTSNRNAIPFDPNGAWYASGLRLGTPAVTTLGMGPTEMKEIAGIIHSVLVATKPAPDKTGKPSLAQYTLDSRAKAPALDRVGKLLTEYPLYPELDLSFLTSHFGIEENRA